MSTKAGIPLGPVGAILGDVILCCCDDSDGLRLRSFLIVESVRRDFGICVLTVECCRCLTSRRGVDRWTYKKVGMFMGGGVDTGVTSSSRVCKFVTHTQPATQPNKTHTLLCVAVKLR